MQETFDPLIKFFSSKKIPVILQTESAECGLACLAMVSNYWGHRVDLPSLRHQFHVSLKGATLKTVMQIAEGLKLQARPVKLELEELGELKLPCILHWNMNHFVVLKQVARNHIVLHDPATGVRRVNFDQVSKSFTGVALELAPSANFSPIESVQKISIGSLTGRVVGLKRSLVLLLLLGLVLQACLLAAPFYIQWVVDEGITTADHQLVNLLAVGFILLTLLQAAFSLTRSWITASMAASFNFQWFGNAFSHLMRLPVPYFEKRHVGDLISRFGSIQSIQHSITTQAVEGVIDSLLALGTFLVMVTYSWLMASLSAAALLLYAVSRMINFPRMRDANCERIIHTTKQQTHFLESARGIQSIRLYEKTLERRIGWLNLLASQFNAELRLAKLNISSQATNAVIFGVERIGVIWFAAASVIDLKLSIGMLFAYIGYKEQFTQRGIAIIDKMIEWRMLGVHAERVADIVLTEPETSVLQPEMDSDPASAPSIELRNISFRYADGEPWVLKDLNLLIPANQCIAITGGSGCGKTTLMKILLGLLEPVSGEVRIGSVPLKALGMNNYRKMLGTVMQEDNLFAGSILENISFFDTHCDPARAQECARVASIHEDILAMPMGYNTLVGDIGSGLSGGQVQRVLLARALYRSPRILILDEATSALDVKNESTVNRAIAKLGLTRILVAHRPETIATAERVIELRAGVIERDFQQVSTALSHDTVNPRAVDTQDA